MRQVLINIADHPTNQGSANRAAIPSSPHLPCSEGLVDLCVVNYRGGVTFSDMDDPRLPPVLRAQSASIAHPWMPPSKNPRIVSSSIPKRSQQLDKENGDLSRHTSTASAGLRSCGSLRSSISFASSRASSPARTASCRGSDEHLIAASARGCPDLLVKHNDRVSFAPRPVFA